MEAHIGELRLTVRAPPGAPSTPDAERFARRVLEALAEQVETRWPGRVILLRELIMSWRLPTGGIAGDEEAQAIAGEIVESLADQVEREAEAPGVPVSVAAFRDDAAYLAAYLSALGSSRGANEWYFAALASDSPRAWPDGTVLAALSRLWRAGRLPAVLNTLPRPWLARAIEATSMKSRASMSRRTMVPPATMISTALSLPHWLDEPAASACLSIAAITLLPSASPSERAEAIRAVLPIRQSLRAIWPASFEPARGADAKFSSAADQCTTEWGGAVYLLSVAMEVGLGEILWSACLPEGALFASALVLLLEKEAACDSLVRMLGARCGDGANVEVSERQQEEVSLQLLDAFVSIRRRHHTGVPPVRLGLRHRGADRFLMACVDGGAFPCFVWTANSMAQLGRGMTAFLDHWPSHSRRPQASPGLAVLDPRGRTLLALDGQVPDSLPLPDSGGAPLAALLVQIAGILGVVWSTRLGPGPVGAGALASSDFRIPGRAYRSSERLDVVLPIDRIDINVRRAGLDRDPGWVPWLQRTVRVEFEEVES